MARESIKKFRKAKQALAPKPSAQDLEQKRVEAVKKRFEDKAVKDQAARAKKVADAIARREEFRNNISEGKLALPEEDVTPSSSKLTPQNAPNAVSYNTNYHDALKSMIEEANTRIEDTRASTVSEAEAKQKAKSTLTIVKNLAGEDVQEWRNAAGQRVNISAGAQRGATVANLDGATSLLLKARRSHALSYAAHATGDAISSAAHFADAADHLKTALHVVNSRIMTSPIKSVINPETGQKSQTGGNTSQRYGDMLDLEKGRRKNPLNIGFGVESRLNDIVNDYANHAVSSGVSSGTLQPHIAEAVLPEVTRKYTEDSAPTLQDIPKKYTVPSPEEKEAAKTRAERTAVSRERNAAMRGFKKPPTKPISDAEAYTPGSVERVATFLRNNPQIKLGKGNYGELAADRWKRDTVRQVFDNDEKQNSESASAAGIDYTPKTFIGSEAHRDPETFNEKMQVKNHWLKANPGKSHEFETSFAGKNHTGYASENKVPLIPLKRPVEVQMRKSSGLYINSNTGATIKGGVPYGFYPTPAESKAADKENQVSVPEDVNEAQQRRVKRTPVTPSTPREAAKDAETNNKPGNFSSSTGADESTEPVATAENIGIANLTEMMTGRSAVFNDGGKAARGE